MQKTSSDYNSGALTNDNEVDFAEIVATLLESKWLIALITALILALGIIKALVDNPVYQADALLQVQAVTSSLAAIEPGGPVVKNEIPVLAEIELINSRTVIGKAIKNLKLDIIAKPSYFPVLGEAVARKYEKNNFDNEISTALLGLTKYAWGGELIKVESLTVPANLLDIPLTLSAGENGSYQLMRNDEVLIKGEVGKLANKDLEDQLGSISLFVSVLKARPNTQFKVIRQSESEAIIGLKKNFHAAEKTKLTRIIELTFESGEPESAVEILNEIVNIFVRQSVEQKSAEAQKTLEFLEKQLPSIKDQLDSAITELNSFKSKVGSVDLDKETQSLLEGVVKTKTEITLLQQKRDGLRQKFTDLHPAVIALDKQIDRLQRQTNVQDRKIEILPDVQQYILKLSRDVKVNTELYTTYLNNAQTLRIAKEGTIGDVRVIDSAALPNLPIKPKKTLIVALSLILGLVCGIALAFIRKALYRGIEDPDLIEKKLGVPVYATIPHSTNQEKLSKKLSKFYMRQSDNPIVLAQQNKDDLAIESLRSLRTTLHFDLLGAKNNIIVITGPSPGIGKTFVSANLASVLADAGKKILLIDGDMRKGYLNKVLGVARKNGLSELISNYISGWTPALEQAIHRVPLLNFDFISTGSIPPNPSELLLHERFGKLLESISKKYDHVIIDSPPILAVTDASIIGRLAGSTLMIVKSGLHPMRELEQSVKQLTKAGVQLKGIVFNDLLEKSSRYGYGYGYNKYANQYSSNKSTWLSDTASEEPDV